jgi:hypothetical protein
MLAATQEITVIWTLRCASSAVSQDRVGFVSVTEVSSSRSCMADASRLRVMSLVGSASGLGRTRLAGKGCAAGMS